MSKEVYGTTKGKDIFNIVDEFFKKNGQNWLVVQPKVLQLCLGENQDLSLT